VIRINLAPPSARKSAGFQFRLPALNLGMLFLVAYAAAVVGIGVYWWQLSKEETRLTDEIERTRRELAMLKPITDQATRVKEQFADLQKRVTTIRDLTQDQGKPIRMFDAFASVVPNDLWVTKMEGKGSVLKVTGSAFSAVAVSDLMTNLRASGKFKEVDIVVSRQDLGKSPRLVTFEVTCRFEG
jgi:type IV pilus assembly protein PilN